jgi:hypothetical protein
MYVVLPMIRLFSLQMSEVQMHLSFSESLYSYICNDVREGVPFDISSWKVKVPLKIKIFL